MEPSSSVSGASESPRRRRRWPLIVVLLLVVLAIDLARAPSRQMSAAVMIAGIHLYRRTMSPWMPAVGARCRFEPTCSHYAEASIRTHGALIGGTRALGRLARCGPWTPIGTIDRPD